MPLADPAGSFRTPFGTMMPGRLFSSRRPPRYEVGGESDDPGAAGAGSTAPLLPRTPVLAGAAARRIEDYAELPKDDRVDAIGRAGDDLASTGRRR